VCQDVPYSPVADRVQPLEIEHHGLNLPLVSWIHTALDTIRYSYLKITTLIVAILATWVSIYFYIHVFDGDDLLFTKDSENTVDTYDFRDTEYEKRCFNNQLWSLNPIPNTVHFIWLENPDITFLGYHAIQSALTSLRPDQLKLHHSKTLNEDNVWLRKVRSRLTLVHHDMAAEYPVQLAQEWRLPHVADVLRLDLIHNKGGIYLDMDVISLKSFDRLRRSKRDLLLGHEGGNRQGLCNGVIVVRKNSSFVTRWMETYDDFKPFEEWNYHSVILPKIMGDEHVDEICMLSPTVFHWPTWTDDHVRYMHENISNFEASAFEHAINKNRGSMLPNQLTYHAWSQVSWDRYLQSLTPEVVRTQNTRFNILVRRFLD
jgi:hypothetical protein